MVHEWKTGPGVRKAERKNIMYVIPEGKHYSTRYPERNTRPFHLWRRWVSMLPFMLIRGRFQKLQVLLTINPDNWHTNPDTNNPDWNDINKLIGVNFGFMSSPHNTSFRIGWINNYEQPGYVDLYLYLYHKGQRRIITVDSPIASVQAGKDLEITIMLGPQSKVYVNVWQEENALFTQSLSPDQKKLNISDLYEDDGVHFPDPKTRYFSVLEPYHGGNEKALKRLEFSIKKLITEYI